MSPDQGMKVTAQTEVDVLAAGKAQNVGEADHIQPLTVAQLQAVGAPIHLSLLTRSRFKADDGPPLRLGA